MNKMTADIICRALLAIVAALRKEYNLSDYRNMKIFTYDPTSAKDGKYGIIVDNK